MKPWIYKGIQFTDIGQFPDNSFGFIYHIENEATKKFYIGKKQLFANRTVKLGKKAIAALEDKRSSKKKTVTKESDWKTYFGSNEELINDIKLYGEDYFHRSILFICSNKKSLTYQEIKHQMTYGVLESDHCYCDNISGKFFRKDAA